MTGIIKKLICYLINHKYTLDIKFDRNIQKIKCSRCGKKFGINHSLKALVDWDESLENDMKFIYPEKFKEAK